MTATSSTPSEIDRRAAACIKTYGDLDTAIQSFGCGFADGPRDLYHHLLEMRRVERAAARVSEAV